MALGLSILKLGVLERAIHIFKLKPPHPPINPFEAYRLSPLLGAVFRPLPTLFFSAVSDTIRAVLFDAQNTLMAWADSLWIMLKYTPVIIYRHGVVPNLCNSLCPLASPQLPRIFSLSSSFLSLVSNCPESVL